MSDEKYNFDYEDGYTRPALWRKTKELWQCATHATTRIIFRRLEKLSDNQSARMNFEVALHHFTTLTPEQRFSARMKYHHWSQMIHGDCAQHHASYGTPLREAPACEMKADAKPMRADVLLPISVQGEFYAVRLTNKPILREGDKVCDCLIDHSKRRIWIRDDVDAKRVAHIVEFAQRRANEEVAAYAEKSRRAA